jgi:hypothetical protein
MKTVLKHGMVLVFASSVILCAVFWIILSTLIGH